jgi:fused signal recognition particle receptor
MEELRKVHRVIGKASPGAPSEVLLVLDATTGQNGLVQAKKFKEAVDVTGIVLTKLDGTAKGGIIFAIVKELGIPVRYIGVGEKEDDLKPFDSREFVNALLSSGEEGSEEV